MATGLQNIENNSTADLGFENCENAGNNRSIPKDTIVGVGNAWIPFRNEGDDPRQRRMILTGADGTYTFYIWQHDKHIRYAEGRDPLKPKEGSEIVPGDSSVANSKHLEVTEDNKLFMSRV